MSLTFEYEPDSERDNPTMEPRWVNIVFDGIPVMRVQRTVHGVVVFWESSKQPTRKSVSELGVATLQFHHLILHIGHSLAVNARGVSGPAPDGKMGVRLDWLDLHCQECNVDVASVPADRRVASLPADPDIIPKPVSDLRKLLRERHAFPEYPCPAEGEVSDSNLIAEREEWQRKWNDLDARIRAALDPPARIEPRPGTLEFDVEYP